MPSLSASSPTVNLTVHPNDEQAVMAAAQALVQAFARHDTDAYFDAFAPDASFLFHSTAEALPDRASYQRLWAQWERESGFRVLACESTEPVVQGLGDVAVFRHRVRTTLGTNEGVLILNERETIVFQRQAGGRWLAVHEHLSPLPTAEETQA
jgi:ketosteroid isomerase-like protein